MIKNTVGTNSQTIFNAYKNLYRMKKITKEDVAFAVSKGLLTPEEYELIVKEPYSVTE